MSIRQVATKASCQVMSEEPDVADARAVRVALAREIARIATEKGLTQCQTAELLGTTQPKVSALFVGKVDGFSVDRLVRFLNSLGQDIHIVMLPSAPEASRATVRVMSVNCCVPLAGGWAYA